MKNYSPPACPQSEGWDVRCSAAAAVVVVTTSTENKGHACRNMHGAATSNPCYKINSHPPNLRCVYMPPWSWTPKYYKSNIANLQHQDTKTQPESKKARHSRGARLPSHVFYNKIQAQKMCEIQFGFDISRTKITIAE